MSEELTGEAQQTNVVTNDDTQPVAASAPSTPTPQPPPQTIVRPPPSQTVVSPVSFMEAYDCAKLNNSWHKVSSAISLHPDWLTKIPTGRRWMILHQIVFSGDIAHLNEVLGFQIDSPEFSFLCKTLDDKTVREVAIERAHVHPQMLRRIERLVATDQLLSNARNGKWDLVKQCISSQPDIVNEKPPFRRLYLAHYLATTGELDMFKELSKKCHFKLDLLADNKTLSQTARENNHTEFADYIDSLTTASSETNVNNSDDDDLPTHGNGQYHYSPGFYEDPGMSFIPANFDVNSLFPSTTSAGFNFNHHAHHPHHHHHHHPTTPNSLFGSLPMTFHVLASGGSMEDDPAYEESAAATQQHNESVQAKPKEPTVTEAEQTAYENTVTGNIKNISEQNLLNSITCPITKAVFRDPVVAADGFTYEREAIENWLKSSNRSPMTNQELDICELKPNHAIKSILQLLQNANPSAAPSNANNGDSASAK